MRSTLASVLVCAATLVALASCGGGGNDAPAGTPINGNWMGGQASGGVDFQITMTITDDGSTVTGNGHIKVDTFQCDAGVDGTRSGETVHLGFKCIGYAQVIFTGHEDNPTTITGHMSGSGFPLTEFDLLKQ